MSLSDGYDTDMRKASISDEVYEAALVGGDPSNANADVVVEFVQGIRNEVKVIGLPLGSEAHILAAAATTPHLPSSAAAFSASVSPRRLRARLAVVVASMMALLLATAGVGLAANDAVPGDPLYGLDRAMERVGLGNGQAHERLAEAVALAEAGQLGRGLNHAAATVATLPDQAQAMLAEQALSDAAARILEDGKAPTGVSELLSHLASLVRTDDGQVIATIAQEIRDTVERGGSEVPAGPPTSTPGRPEGLPGRGPGN